MKTSKNAVIPTIAILLLLVAVLISGCTGEKASTQKASLVVEPELINAVSNQQSTFNYTISNQGKEEICYYTQVICTSTLSGASCNDATFTEDSTEVWSWFKTNQHMLIAAGESKTYTGTVKGQGQSGTYLGTIFLWTTIPEEGKCSPPEGFATMYNTEKVAKFDFRLNLQ